MVVQCHSKQVLDYIRQHGKRDSGGSKDSVSKGKKGQRKTSGSESSLPAESSQDDVCYFLKSNLILIHYCFFPLTTKSLLLQVNEICNKIEVMHVSENTPFVIIDKEVKSVRPHIVCCIVKGLTFTPESLKKFIKLQVNIKPHKIHPHNVELWILFKIYFNFCFRLICMIPYAISVR